MLRLALTVAEAARAMAVSRRRLLRLIDEGIVRTTPWGTISIAHLEEVMDRYGNEEGRRQVRGDQDGRREADLRLRTVRTRGDNPAG